MFVDAVGPALSPRRRSPAAPSLGSRRTRPVRPSDAPVREPHWAEVPDWSEATLAKLAALTPLEQAVVVWRVAGYSGAEAYRKATGRDSPSARQSANQILRRPEVAAAVEAGLKDRNYTALLDRGWMLLKLRAVVEECSEMRTPAGGNTLISAIRLMAQLQGELPFGRRGCRRRVEALPEPAGRSAVRERIDEILAEVARLTSGPTGARPEPSRLDQLVAAAEAEAARRRPGPAVVGPPAGAPPATPSVVDAATPVPAQPADSTPPSPADGLPLGVVRPFIPPTRPARPEASEPGPAEPLADGPVLPRGGEGPVRYRGASPYFLGNWA
jgi:hypothetical protein